MAKTILTLNYSWGPEMLDARVSKMGHDKFVVSTLKNGRAFASITLNADEYTAFIDELHVRFDHPREDFNSVFAFHNFVQFGKFDVDEYERMLAA